MTEIINETTGEITTPKPNQKIFTIPTQTKQSFQKECDINNVMSHYEKTGILTHVREGQPHYGDFEGADDYHSAMNRILEAQDAFMAIPSQIRAQFANDPGKFLEFAQDPDNHDQMVEMGLINPTSSTPPETPQPRARKPRPDDPIEQPGVVESDLGQSPKGPPEA